MRIVLLSSRPIPAHGSMWGECLTLLRGWGAEIDVPSLTDPISLAAPAVAADLALLRSVDDVVTSVAEVVEATGGRCVSPVRVTRLCRDRVAITARLAAAGIPVPESWVASDLTAIHELLVDGPLVVRPARAGQDLGARVIWDADELADGTVAGQPWLVQRRQPTRARDRKIYRIGEQVFGVKRRWPARSLADKTGEPFTVSCEIQEVTDRVALVLGTDLFGLDLIETDDGPVVVDVHPFPGFKGVPEAPLRLADYLYAVAADAVPTHLEVAR